MMKLNRWVAISLAVVTCACSATDGDRLVRLPFKVSVLPVDLRVVEDPSMTTDNATTMKLAVDSDVLRSQIASVLGSQVFAGAESESVELARSGLLVECSVRLVETVATARNDRFWLNMLLFAVGGPATWFVPDRSYRVVVYMTANLHQAEPIRDGRATLQDGRARLASVQAQVDEIALPLLSRTSGSPLPLLGSLVIPASFLATENEVVQQRLGVVAAEQLAAELGRQIAGLAAQIESGAAVTDVMLGPVLKTSRDRGGLRVRALALLRTGASSRLASWTVSMGGTRVSGEFGDGARDPLRSVPGEPPVLCYPIDAFLPGAPADGFLEIELNSGGRDRERRVFSLPLQWTESED